MRKGANWLLMVLCGGALLASGCAKEGLVKKDETAPTAAAQPVEKPAQQSPVKAEVVKSQPIREAAATPQEEARATGEAIAQAEKTLATVYFDFDSYTLSQSTRDTLSTNAQYLLKRYKGPVKLEGNCDERGSDEYNLALGEKRAKAVYDYLVTLGVPADRLSTISYGKEKPVDPGHDEAAWAKNRRVDFAVEK